MIVNPCVNVFPKYEYIHCYFISFRHTEMTQVVEISVLDTFNTIPAGNHNGIEYAEYTGLCF